MQTPPKPATAGARFRIRDATPDDRSAIAAFNVALAWESEGLKLDADVVGRGVRRALNSPMVCRYFVADVGRELIGQTMINYEVTDWRDGYVWWIHSVYVRPDWRGRGVFRGLFQHIEDLARRSGDVRNLRLFVETNNKQAIKTYEQLGMQRDKYHVYNKLLLPRASGESPG